MGVKAVNRVELKDFAGLVTNLDPDDLTPGSAQEQTNAMSDRAAMLETRPGYLVVKFEDS